MKAAEAYEGAMLYFDGFRRRESVHIDVVDVENAEDCADDAVPGKDDGVRAGLGRDGDAHDELLRVFQVKVRLTITL